MRMKAQSWRQPATFCASSSGNRCWGCRSSSTRSPRQKVFVTPLTKNCGGAMDKTIWVGAVAYNPKVVTIWEGMRRYFHEEAHLPVEVVLFQSYEMQVAALLAGPADSTRRIDIAWNTNLAYLQADSWSDHRCRPIAMRDTDLGWMTKIVAVSGGAVSSPCPLQNRRPRRGRRDA